MDTSCSQSQLLHLAPTTKFCLGEATASQHTELHNEVEPEIEDPKMISPTKPPPLFKKHDFKGDFHTKNPA